MPVENLALALSSSMTAGINFYLTTLGLGYCQVKWNSRVLEAKSVVGLT